MERVWVDLKYKDENYGDIYEISNDGWVRHKARTKPLKVEGKGSRASVVLYLSKDRTTRRVNIGQAQIESGLESSMLIVEGVETSPFTNQQQYVLQQMRGEILSEIKDLIDNYNLLK